MNRTKVTRFGVLILLMIMTLVPQFTKKDPAMTMSKGRFLMADTLPSEDRVTETADTSAQDQDMLYTVLAIVLIIWFGISIYLYIIDRKLSRIERELHEE